MLHTLLFGRLGSFGATGACYNENREYQIKLIKYIVRKTLNEFNKKLGVCLDFALFSICYLAATVESTG